MNLELILWIAGGIILWEILYIIALKTNDGSLEWLEAKFYTFFIASMIIGSQLGLVFINDSGEARYINLLWEALIVGGLVLFFLLNKWIADKIE